MILRVADYKIPENKDEYGYNAHMNGFVQLTMMDNEIKWKSCDCRWS